MEWKIEPIKRSHTLYEEIADVLEEMILAEGTDSERLPTEFELTKSFGVSRTVIREALKLLQERGLVKMRAGDGTYITKPKSSTMMHAMNRLVRFNNLTDWDITLVRVIIECAACELACEKITDQAISELESLLDKMIENKANLHIRVKKDCEFHCAIARLSQNELLVFFVESIHDLLYSYMRKRIEFRPEGNNDGILWHRRIIDALKLGNPNLASGYMREHIIASFQQINPNEVV